MAAPDFVGREAELRVLGQQLRRCVAGSAVLTLVEGDAGIGKTRLVHEFVATMARQGPRVVWVESDEVARPVMGMCSRLIRELGSFSTPDPLVAASQRRWEMLEALLAVLREAAPVLVVLEDLHWADEDSLWVFERLPGRLADAPVHLLATARSDEPEAAPLGRFRRRAEVVLLGGLSADHVGALATAVAADRAIDVAGLAARTGGSPLFVRELLALDDDGDLPPAVTDVLERHLRRLEPRVLRSVAALALAGPTVTFEVLASAVGTQPAALADDLEEAARARVLVSGSAGPPRFRHALYGSTAAAMTGPAARRTLHAELASAWAEHDHLDARVAELMHRLAALPLGDPATVGEGVLVAAETAVAAGRIELAVGLLGTACDVLASYAGVPRQLFARLAYAHGDALWETGYVPRAIAAFEAAAALAAAGDDPALLAASEAAAARHVDPLSSDPDRIRRLLASESRLPEGDHPVRVAVFGRLAVLHAADPDLTEQAIDLGDRAVAMARRIGDAALLITALLDRHLVAMGVHGLEARDDAADEIVRLGDGLRRPDLAAFGHEWRFEGALEQGDRPRADAALDRLHLSSLMMPSPEWRYKVLFRRAMMHLCDGDRTAALDLLPEIRRLGLDLVREEENVGLELSVRTGARLLWGMADPRHDELTSWVHARLADAPPYVQVVLAAALWSQADLDEARRIVDTCAPAAARLLTGYRGVALVGLLGAVAAAVEREQHVAVLRASLSPYRGRVLLATVPMACDSVLGHLAALAGDRDAAVEHHGAAVAKLRSIPLPGLVPRALTDLADALDGVRDPAASATRREADRLAARFGMRPRDGGRPAGAGPPWTGGQGILRRLPAGWEVASPLGGGEVVHSRGMTHLAHLLASPGVEVAATELAVAGRDLPVSADLGPSLDARAKREYRRRVAELQGDIDEAETANDHERAARARVELDALLDELRRAVGLGGRDRPSGSGAERARVNSTRNLRRAIAAITAVAPDLGAHLDRSIRTGTFCAYDPEPAAAMVWTIEGDG